MPEWGNDTLTETYVTESTDWPYDERPDIIRRDEEDWI